MVRTHPDPPELIGGVAQLGEHLLCKQGVVGSIPVTSTSFEARRQTTVDGNRPLSPVPWTEGCSLFNNLGEVCASIFKNRCMGCDCINQVSLLAG